jgi:hypothetical protein
MNTTSRTMAMILAGTASALTLSAIPAAAHAATTKTPECGSRDVKASYKATDAGMSHVFGKIRLRNVSDHACTVQGYGGLSFVGRGNGTQIGAPAARDSSPTPRVVLQPHQRAVSKVSITTTGPYSRQQCRPTRADGFRVYVPDSKASQFVRHPMQVCGNASLVTLTHQAYRHA